MVGDGLLLQMFRYGLLALGVLFGASVAFPRLGSRRRLRRGINALVWAGIAWLIVGEPALRGFQQYQAWVSNPATVGLVTGESSGYIYSYTVGRFALWRWIAGVIAATLFWLANRFVVAPSGGMRLNRPEAFLIAFGVILAGWPGFLFYLLALFALYLAVLGALTIRLRGRISGEVRMPVAIPATIALAVIPFTQHLLVWLSNLFEINLLLLNVTNVSQ